jgi:hypothetical protein
MQVLHDDEFELDYYASNAKQSEQEELERRARILAGATEV